MTEPDDVAELIDALEQTLDGSVRSDILRFVEAKGPADSLKRLRSAMSGHSFPAGEGTIDLVRLVRRLDNRTRREGFRVLHAWNHNTHAFTDDIVPALTLDFLERARGAQAIPQESSASVTVAIALDYYFLHLLALCAMRAWDTPDPDATLGRVAGLVALLQGRHGSGHQFVADAETLVIYALSQFHPEETAYDRFMERVATLSDARQLAFATASAAVLSAHLRWGFWLMYDRDPVRMRRDNLGDYPWLLLCVGTLLHAFDTKVQAGSSAEERADIVQALLQALAADPWAFRGKAPEALAGYRSQYDEVMSTLERVGPLLLEELALQEPDKRRYEPLALHFNFPHNALVAIVTLALLEGRPQLLPLNALFRREHQVPDGSDTQEELARALMAFSRGSPDRLGYRGAMLVAYDPLSGRRSFGMTLDVLRKPAL